MSFGHGPRDGAFAACRTRGRWFEMILLTLGTVVVALGVHFFKFPNHFAMGGVAGISVVVGAVLPFASPATVTFFLNILLLFWGYLVFGKELAVRTAYATVLLSVLQVIFERVIPVNQPLTNDALLELFFAILCSAFGSALVFNQQGSTGGTDIVAMIVRKYTTLDIGKALFASDIVIGATTFFIFDIKTGLYSLCGIFLKGVMVDALIEGFNRVKYFTIVCSRPEEISCFVTHDLHRGCTRLQGEGVFSKEGRTVLLCVVDRYQAALLQSFVKRADPKAFMMITNTSEIVGRGFHAMI